MLRPIDNNDIMDALFLWQLLQEREHPISHDGMPMWIDHLQFVRKHPYRYWYIIEDGSVRVGAIYLGNDNSIGVVIAKKFQRRGWARKAICAVMVIHDPLPAIPSVRSRGYIANIAPGNAASVALFKSLGFGLIQETYRHE